MRTSLACLTALALTLTACGGGDPGQQSEPVASVTVTPSPATVTVGQTVQLSATLKDAAGNTLSGRAVTWSSNNVSVANVSNTGLVSGVAVGGPVTITATSEGQNGTAQVTVQAGAPTQLTLSTQPSGSGQSGSVLAQQPAVQVRDAGGNAVAQGGVTVTASLSSGTATLANATAVTNVNGLATFSGLTISGPSGTYTLTFSATGLTSVSSGPITLAAGSATRLSITTQPPPSGQVGVALSQQPVLQLLDASNNPVGQSGVLVTATVSTGSGTVSSGTATTNASGVATFSGLAIVGQTGTYTLSFAASGLVSATSTPVVISAGAPATLTMVTQPSATAQSGVAFPSQPIVEVKDAGGNVLAGQTVAASIETGGGTLSTPASVATNASGLAIFSGLTLTGTPGNRTLRFTSGSASVVSAAINLTAGPPTALTITTQPPSSAVSGAALNPQPAVQLRDGTGNAVNQSGVSVTATLATGTGSLANASATTNASGLATFTGLTITGAAGSYSLTFGSPGLSSVTSNAISLTAGSATKVTITTQPSANGQAGVALPTQPVVQLRDASDNPVSQSGVTVTATLASGTGTLSNATAVTNASGQATFSGLAITGAAGNYTLSFGSPGLTSAVSSTITLAAGPATQLTITTQPSANAQSGVAFPQQPQIQLRDAAGNAVSQSGVNVTATLASGTGTVGNGSATTNASGLATFSGLAITGAAGNYTLSFNASGLASVVSNTIALTAGTPTQLSITTQPSSSAQSGVAFAQQPQVQLRDASNNPVGQAGVSINATIATGPGGATLSNASATTNASGLATFSGLAITGSGGTYTLSFNSAGLTSATSNSITLQATLVNKIVFSTDRDGNYEIYAMNPDGTGSTRLTNNGVSDAQPQVSFDRTKIVFTRGTGSGSEIWVMNADGSNATQLTSNSATDDQPTWSPDGTKIAFRSDRSGSMDIWVMNADGSSPVNRTSGASTSAESFPAYSPNGALITFTTDRDGNAEIYSMDANTGGSVTNLTNDGGADFDASWSRDGSKLAFVSDRDGQLEIYVMNANGSSQERRTNDLASDVSPSWNPDGTKITFASERSGTYAVYTMNSDGFNVSAALTTGNSNVIETDWSR